MTLLMLAILKEHYGIVRSILAHGGISPIKTIDEYLLIAARKKYYEIMFALIEHGAIVDIKNSALMDALKEALQDGVHHTQT